MKFKERFKKFSKEFFAQYDILKCLGNKEYSFREFTIIYPCTITLPYLMRQNSWSVFQFRHEFIDKETMCEFMFRYHYPRYYPQRHGYFVSNKQSEFDMLCNKIEDFKKESLQEVKKK